MASPAWEPAMLARHVTRAVVIEARAIMAAMKISSRDDSIIRLSIISPESRFLRILNV
jgi:hypothetical protein